MYNIYIVEYGGYGTIVRSLRLRQVRWMNYWWSVIVCHHLQSQTGEELQKPLLCGSILFEDRREGWVLELNGKTLSESFSCPACVHTTHYITALALPHAYIHCTYNITHTTSYTHFKHCELYRYCRILCSFMSSDLDNSYLQQSKYLCITYSSLGPTEEAVYVYIYTYLGLYIYTVCVYLGLSERRR